MQELRCKANTRSPSPSSLPLPPGANSVVACEMQESLCEVARKAAAANGLSDKISIIQRDGGLLQRGREVRALGVNVVVADVFDAGAVPRLRFLLVFCCCFVRCKAKQCVRLARCARGKNDAMLAASMRA